MLFKQIEDKKLIYIIDSYMAKLDQERKIKELTKEKRKEEK